ncbi:hypothetical protein EVAR_7542_1 [Eumeta japonica]|uniref:Uncharacterized protein n=1 Tax=Eumeta variegata TaxID=151549 RepID=A0A4C1VPF4_EUMVA|nr:hypothetical protein EVAR_7542_1 [Eumeta japonica]
MSCLHLHGKQVSFNQQNNELEVETRVNITWKKFWSLKEILKSDTTIGMKTRVMNICLLPSLNMPAKLGNLPGNYSQKVKWRWSGCVAGLGDNRRTTKTTLWAGPSGQRKRGRPNARWADDITEVAGVQWTRAAEDREYWLSLEEAFTFHGDGSCQYAPVYLT